MTMAKRTKQTLITLAAALLFVAAVRTVFSLAADNKDPFSLDILDSGSFTERYQRIEPVQPISPDMAGAYEDVPPDHWAYRAVKHLTEIGLLTGYDGNRFNGDRPVTRYELSVIISRLVYNFNEYIRTGSLPQPEVETATVQPPMQTISAPPEGATQTIQKRSKPTEAGTTPGELIWRDARPELGPVAPLSHSRPKALEIKGKEPEKTDQADAGKDAKKDEKDKKAPKPPKEFDKLAKKVDLTEKDIEILNALIDYIRKDVMKEIKDDVKKQVSAVSKLAQRNERDIEKLQEENERFKVTGSVETGYSSTLYTNNDAASSSTSRSLSTNLYSRPRKFDDMTFRSSLTSSGDLKIQYQDLTSDVQNPRNFKLRMLYAGNVSVGTSYLTSGGKDFYGFQSEAKLNDYTFKSYLGKIDSDGSSKYIHAESLQFSLFGKDGSWGYLSYINSWCDKDKATTDSKYLPGEKNSVRSFYTRYPLPVKGLYMTAEYAHSTFYRPHIDMTFPDKTSNLTWDEQFQNWIYIHEIAEQDDAFFVLLDYNKGPLSIFPMGYIRLGPKFVSNYLGLPGFSADDLGIDVLPIKLQSLAVYIFRGTITKTEDKFKDEFMYLMGGETEPMFLDTYATKQDESMDTLVQFNLIARLNNRARGDTIKLSYFDNKLYYYMSDDISITWKYSNVKAGLGPLCLDGNLVYVKDDHGDTIHSSIGNGYADCDAGSPTYDSEDLALSLRILTRSQAFNIFWRTSKKAEFSMDYGFDDTRIVVTASLPGLDTAITDLVPQGRNYYAKYNFKYRLTDVSRIEMWYNTEYARPDIHLSEPDKTLEASMGIKLSMDY